MHIASKRCGAVEASIANTQPASFLPQTQRRGFCHFARAEQQYDAIAQFTEDAPREVDSHAGYAYRSDANGRLGPHALRDREGAVHTASQNASQRARRESYIASVLHLTENLRLPDDHRIEARRDAEDMGNRLLAGLFVKIPRKVTDVRSPGLTRNFFAHRTKCGLGVTVRRVRDDFVAIARRQKDHALELAPRSQSSKNRRQCLGVGHEALAHFDRRRAVRQANYENHGAVQATVPAAATPRTR
jgi:hypothetical protein